MIDKNIHARSNQSKFDSWLIIASTALVFFGLLAIYDASVVTAFKAFGDKFYYFKNQLVWAGLGFIALGFFSFYDYHKLLKYSPIYLFATILLLVAVLIPGIGVKVYGARRWINIGSFTIQPSELTKLALIFYQAAIINKFEDFKIRILDVALILFLPVFIAALLVLIQPDLGTALIFIAVTIATYFVSKSPIWHFLLAMPVFVLGAIVMIITHPYRLARIKAFLDPNFDPQGASYQINQILSAISAGGLLGVGIGASRSKFAFIPEVHSDAIFAIIVEELGFIGALITLSILVFLFSRAIKVAKESSDYAGKVLASGIVALLSIQSLFNLASIVALVPLTGIPLPFISYGGSSLLITMSAIGILINIKRQS